MFVRRKVGIALACHVPLATSRHIVLSPVYSFAHVPTFNVGARHIK